MNRKLFILIFPILAAFALSSLHERNDQVSAQIPFEEISRICTDELNDNSSMAYDFGLTRQNSFSSPARNVQTGHRTSNHTLSNIYFIKTGGCPTLNHSFRSCSRFLSQKLSVHNPDRILSLLCRLVI